MIHDVDEIVHEMIDDTVDHIMDEAIGARAPTDRADEHGASEHGARVRIVGLGGSLAEPSASLRALELALESAASTGAEVELLDLRTLRLPLFDPTLHYVPRATLRLAACAAEADAMIWSSPTYHGAMSGAFKNALDWLQLLAEDEPPYLTDRPVGLIATSAGSRAMQTVNSMASAAQALRSWTLPLCVTVGRSYEAFDADGVARDPAVAGQLAALGRSTVQAAHRFAGAASGSRR